MSESRRDIIKQFINEKGEVQFKELEQLSPDISAMTIRRDLAFLENEGTVLRTWGGAKAVKRTSTNIESIFSLRITENIHAKNIIAKKAMEFMETGRSIFIDSGTTTNCLAKIMPDLNFSILTTAPNIALEIIRNANSSITLIGGQLSRSNLTTSGANSINFLKNINIDIAFLAASGFSQKNGFTIGNFDECELKKAVIKKAGKTILLMDRSKIDRNMSYTFATLKHIDILICDVMPDEVFMINAEKHGVEVL